MEISKSDWALFRMKLPEWQEAYMNTLNQEYIALLSSDQHPSEKFWALDARMAQDRQRPGVRLQLKKSTLIWNLVELIRDGTITTGDLRDFSEELRQQVEFLLTRKRD